MKANRFLTTLLLAAPLCLGETCDDTSVYDDEFGEDYEEAEDKEYTVEEQKAAFTNLYTQAQQMADCLQGVTDTATADAAAPIFTHLQKQISDSRDILFELANYEPSDEEAELYATLESKISELRKKLEEEFFYSSEALAKAVTHDAMNAHAPLPMPPEIEKELSIISEFRFNASQDGEELQEVMSGGPGFSRDTAWICSSKKAAIAREFARDIILNIPCDSKRFAKKEERVVDGKTYVVVTAYFTVDNARYIADVWTDITIAINQYTPEQKQAALGTFISYTKIMYEALDGVTDKASADAAADTIQAERKKMTNEVLEILHGLDTQILIDAQNQHLPAKEAIYAIYKRIRDNEYFGSEKLSEL